MKKIIINFIIGLCYRIDNRRGVLEHYDYETSPYCGHHYSGTKGVLYNSDYHEGEGVESADILGFRFCSSTDDDLWWSFKYKVVREVYLDGKLIAKHNYTTFFNEVKAILHRYKYGFKLTYRLTKR